MLSSLRYYTAVLQRSFEESSKLRRFYAEDCQDFLGKFNNILDKIVWKSSEICTFLKILNFNFPHIMLSSTAGKICLSCCLKENFNNENFSFSFENLRIFEDLRRICNLRRSSKNFWINEDSSSSSSVYFQEPKNLRIRLRPIFNLRCNTGRYHHNNICNLKLGCSRKHCF